MTARAKLLDAPLRARKARTSRELVPLDTTSCPDCGGMLVSVVEDQRAFFLHGGYGGTTRTVTDWCSSCRWGRVRARTTENPRRT